MDVFILRANFFCYFAAFLVVARLLFFCVSLLCIERLFSCVPKSQDALGLATGGTVSSVLWNDPNCLYRFGGFHKC